MTVDNITITTEFITPALFILAVLLSLIHI